jgi:outer membrane protein assembly factor BamB
VIVVSDDGHITAVDVSTGRTAWASQFTFAKPGVSAFGEKQILVSDGTGDVRLIDGRTGQIITTLHTDFRTTALSLAGDNEMLLGDERGNLIRLNPMKNEDVWKFRSGGGISGIVEVGSDLVVTSLDNFVYRISGGNGGVIWKRRQRGRILDLPVIEKGLTVVLSLGEPSAALFEGQKGKPAGQIELADGGSFVQRPLVSDSALIFFTNTGVVSYRQDGCPAK